MSVKSANVLRRLIYEQGELVITPLLDPDRQVNKGSASIDLRLGTEFVVSRRGHLPHINSLEKDFKAKVATLQNRYYVGIGSRFVLHPGHFVLGSTLEYLKLPDNLCGNVVTRSSWGRYGLIIATAVAVQPGYRGCLTLELRNLAEVPLLLYPGSKVLQIFFYDVADPEPGGFDASSYLGATGPGTGTFGREEKDREIIEKFPQGY